MSKRTLAPIKIKIKTKYWQRGHCQSKLGIKRWQQFLIKTQMCKLAFHTWQHVPAQKSLDIQSQQNIGGLRVPGNWFCRLPILWALGKSWRKVDLYLYLYLFFQLSLYLYIFLYLRVYLYLYLAQTLWENLWPRWVCPSLVPDPLNTYKCIL